KKHGVAYPIEAPLAYKLVAVGMAATNDAQICRGAKDFAATAAFLRTKDKADASAISGDIADEEPLKYAPANTNVETTCRILPTAPFVTPKKIIEGYDKLIEGEFVSVFPVLEFSFPIQRSLKIEGNKVVMVWNEYLNTRSQDLEPRYHDSGQFYWLKSIPFSKEQKMFTDNSGAIVISELHAQDIDTENDWKLAEIKYKLMLNDQENN